MEIIGLMSGTSLDGLDIAHVKLVFDSVLGDSFELMHFSSIPFPEELRAQLRDASTASIATVTQLDIQLGTFFASCVRDFMSNFSIDSANITAIGCHGQTILHQPQLGYTLQIGNANVLAYQTGIRVINDFRSHDLCAGGQGAPLVPIGDFGLFREQADTFLNLGGFANLSYKDHDGFIRAYDICPLNVPLNKLVESIGLTYDKDGGLASQGEIHFFLLDLLNTLPYYHEDGPKSLGTEWLETQFYPLLKFNKTPENNLRTVVEHCAIQISGALEKCSARTVLCTGGGAKNSFVIERIRHYFSGELKLPSEEIIDFKEAIVFAYLAGLKLNGSINSLFTVTGATRNTIGGVIHDPGY
jgi:anhydro-N-acetylmuramic acid kinase